jgi:hypothetical protein
MPIKAAVAQREDRSSGPLLKQSAETQESVLAHAAALGLPVERCFQVETDLAPSTSGSLT